STARTRLRASAAPSVGAAAAYDGAKRPAENDQVQPERPLTDVRDVQPQAIVEVQLIPAGDLPEARDSGLHLEPCRVPQPIGIGAEGRGAGPDQAHVSQQDVEYLWQLVQARLAQDPAHSRYARVVDDLEIRIRQYVEVHVLLLQLLGIAAHATELPHAEPTSASTGSELEEENRTRRIEPDGDGAYQQGQHHSGQDEQAQHDVQKALRALVPDVVRNAVRDSRVDGHLNLDGARHTATQGVSHVNTSALATAICSAGVPVATLRRKSR